MTLAAILAFAARNWRLMLPLAGIAAVLLILAYARHQGREAEVANERADVAEQQAKNTDNAFKSTERTHKREEATKALIDHYTPIIQSAPGAQDVIDPVLASD